MNLQRGTDAVFAMSLATMMLRATMSGRVGEPGEPGLDVQARLRGTSQAHG
ncbi:hypothetical protein MGG_16640 [Pyricularia oryzae 70-15]|uniref:Uncharacterized protein n=1 Tax=Pyricularia oryzae (strain 70-15 / ATCC MYA-4617 / FGSC 8958) TaxID=242507 RepID=G4N173_PYRO7|nr:uncharacterized protein MGG_16640 [Pyricularia oryzae 70-15]EHA51552.1 hypothetical protein MGG_16640 [Pyricularia oryzae 70-15]